jgi:prepilin-type N-terminal cleavage/methylation domain-containing protein
MNRQRSLLNSEQGMTLTELILTVAILSILLAIASASYDVLKANLRFSKVRADMDAIAKSAYNDFTTTNVWAPLTFASMPANWASNGELRQWPAAPCPGWYYSWEDWSAFGYPVTQVTIRRGDNTLLWGFCLDTAGGSSNCQIADPIFGGSGATDINTTNTHAAYCNE